MTIRLAELRDLESIISLIRELADTKKHTGPIASKEHIKQSFFDQPSPIQVYVMEREKQVIGMAHIIVYPSTFADRNQISLQDFAISEAHRGKGYGKEFMKFLCRLALEKNYRRITWNYLKWNEPAAHFYEKIGNITDDIATCTMDESRMSQMLESKQG